MSHKIQYLRDNFEGLSLNTDLWDVTGPGLAYFDGAVQLTPSSTATILESGHSYSLAESRVDAHFTLPGAGETRSLTMAVRVDDNNELSISLVNGTLTFRVRVAGVNSDTTLAVDRDTMDHWRIEESAGVAYFYTSSDGIAWAQRRVATHGLTLTSVTLRITCLLTVSTTSPTYGGGTYGSGFYGGVSGVEPHVALIHGINRADSVPSTTPPVITAERAPRWRWALGDWRDGAPSHEMLYAGNRALRLHLKTPSEATFTTWGESDEAMVMSEGISDLWVIRNTDTLFRGRISRADDEIDDAKHSVNASATDYRGLMERRNLVADVTETAVDQATIVRNLVSNMQAQTGGNLGIKFYVGDVDTWATTGVARTVEFKDGQSVNSCLSRLGNMENGFDLEVDENLLLKLHYPQMGSDNGEVLDLGGTVSRATRTLNMDKYGNFIRQSGADEIVAVNKFSDNLEEAPEGRWDLQFGDIDLKTNDMVEKTAASKLAQSQQLLPTYRLTMAAGAWRGPEHVWLGDTVTAVVKSGRVSDVLKLRVYDLDIEVDINDNETVTVTVGDSKLTIASMLHRINQNIRAMQRR
jgi:hypothetical protein